MASSLRTTMLVVMAEGAEAVTEVDIVAVEVTTICTVDTTDIR